MKRYYMVALVFALLLPLGCAQSEQTLAPTTTTTTSTLSQADAQTIAQTKIDAYWTATIFGVCCDTEAVDRDLSRFLTDEQRQMYASYQWRITCCKTDEQVNAHVRSHIDDPLIPKPADTFVFCDDQSNLYVVLPSRGIDKYRIVVKEFSETNITAVCEILEMGSTDLVACRYDFSLEKRNNDFIIVDRSEAYDC